MTKQAAVEQITYLNQWKHLPLATIGEQIGLRRDQVRAIRLGQESIEGDAAERLGDLARQEGYPDGSAA